MRKGMRKGWRFVLGPMVAVALVAASGMLPTAAAEGEIFAYRPTSTPLMYEFTLESKGRLDASGSREVIKTHNDALKFEVIVRESKNGLLHREMTVTSVNPGPSAFRKNFPGLTGNLGSNFRREQVIGETELITTDVLGQVTEGKGIPQFQSPAYYNRSWDGPPFDMHRLLITLHPTLPLRHLKKGDTWKLNDEVPFTAAPIKVLEASIEEQRFGTLDSKITRKLKYRLIDFVDRDGNRLAKIAVSGSFRRNDAAQIGSSNLYKKVNGRVEGDIFFDNNRGIVVEASLRSNLYESFFTDGPTNLYWLGPRTMIFLVLQDGQTTPPLGWRVQQTVRFKLKHSKRAAAR